MKEIKVRFLAGLVAGFGFYIAWMIVAMNWQTATTTNATIKNVLGLFLGLVVGVLLYVGIYFLVNRKREATISKRITRYAILGMVAGLIVAFFVGMLFYDPTGLGPAPIFALRPLFPLD